MKLKNKLLLGSLTCLGTVGILSPIMVSCKQTEEPKKEVNLHGLYKQEKITQQTSVSLSKDHEDVIFSKDPNKKGKAYFGFQVDANHPTTPNAYYMLLRDTKTDEIFASFVGWKSQYDIQNWNGGIPNTIDLPDGYYMKEKNNQQITSFPVRAIGVSWKFADFRKIDNDYNAALDAIFDNHHIFEMYIEKNNIFDKNNHIKYLFPTHTYIYIYIGDENTDNSVVTLKFPQSLEYMDNSGYGTTFEFLNTSSKSNSLILDFSETQITQLSLIATYYLSKLIIPDRIKRIDEIRIRQSEDKLVEITHLDKIKFFGYGALKKINFSNKNINLANDVYYYKNSFPEDVIVTGGILLEYDPHNPEN